MLKDALAIAWMFILWIAAILAVAVLLTGGV